MGSRLHQGSGDVSNARDRLKGALQELLEQSDDSSVSSHDETSQEPVVVPPPQNLRSLRPQRKRRRREAVNDAAFHHTYVMKLFDRSVDLAQFKEDTPLYPICRAWMANQPRNTNLVPKDTYKMPPPLPIPGENQKTLRVPSPVPQPKDHNSYAVSKTSHYMDEDIKPSRETLLHNHLVHWTSIRKKWHAASHKNEERFEESGKILKAIYKKAQKAFE
ncbi:Protein lin-37 [Blattella germanica]|nr:Protein lin-37 [Blattella germanica]